MSSIGLVSLAQALSNQGNTPSPETQPAQKATVAHGNQAPQVVAEDQFTPSTQNGQQQATVQAAGLFSVAQTPFFSAAANSLLRQSAASQANPATATATTTTNRSTAQTAAPTPVTVTPVPAAGAMTSLVVTQEQLQALNLALAALGLNTQDIQQLDQIASAVNDYHPVAYTARALQLKALGKRSPTQATVPAGANARPAPANANAVVSKAAGTNTAAAAGNPTKR